MKSFSHFSEDIASRRKMFKQRQAQQAADYKDSTVGAMQRAKQKAAEKEKSEQKLGKK